ncbi:MAG: ATP-binding protein [Proteobacteria bacterium]|nr:ATP-binding protein [Pseudomonadota bacterium]
MDSPLDMDLQTVLDAVLDGLVVVDDEARVLRLNAEACRILETSVSAARGEHVEQLLGKEHRAVALIQQVLASRRPVIENDVEIERRFDVNVRVNVSVSPSYSGSGQTQGVVLSLRDRTIENTLRATVEERAQLDSFGHIAAGIAHELKNPLGGIRGAGELIATRSEDARTGRAAELIVREVDRITSLVDDLMVFAKSEELRLEPLNLHQVLDGTIDLLTHDPLAKGVAFERLYDPSIPEFVGDSQRLTQVFLNLGRNALQALEASGGSVSVTTRMSLERRLTDDRGRHLPTVVVSLTDTGPGIDADTLARLGTPFFTTRAEGTGLGLALSQHWIARHGGTLRVTSEPGQGTRVRVALPLRRPS